MSSVGDLLERWRGMSPWACPDPELWEQVASELNHDGLIEHVLHHIHYRKHPDGGFTLESLGIPPWLLTDLLDRAEGAEWTESDSGELSQPMADLLLFIEAAEPHEWVTRSDLAERLFRWAESDDARLVSAAYAMGLNWDILPDTNTVRLLHLKLMVRVAENRGLQNLELGTILLSQFRFPDIMDEETDAYLCRVAAGVKGSRWCSSTTLSFIGAAIDNKGAPIALSPSVTEAWMPLIHKELLADTCTRHTLVDVARIDPVGTWRNHTIRRKIITRLSLDMKESGRFASEVMATWTKPGVRCLLKEARVIYGELSSGSLEERDSQKGPDEEPVDRDAAMRRILVAAGSRYPHLLTEDEALALCMSPDVMERQVGMLASAEATPTPYPTTRPISRSTLPQSTKEEAARTPAIADSPV